jgi:hypothetical protein
MKTTMVVVALGLAAIGSTALLGCEKGTGGATATTGSEAAEDLAGGTKYDPPIKPEAVPAGHWYCDMGTVHYARATEGDGKCSLCGMKLKHKE